ncbi:MAG: sialidase family protein [Wenzhouxiangellaceae bacterium]
MSPTKFRTGACLAALLLLTGTMAYAELRIVENPAGDGALAPALVEMPDDAGIVLSWLEKHGDGHAFRFSVFGESGFSDSGEIARGRDWFANWADTPGIHVRADGGWLAHWLEKSADSTYAYDVRLAHSSDGGKQWSRPQTPHTDGTPAEHGFVSYFPAGRGRTGLVWLDGRETLSKPGGEHEHAGFMTLRTAIIGTDGTAGPERLIDDRVCDCCQTASAVTAAGPIVAYRNRTEDEIRDIAIVRRTPDGWTEPRLVHADGWKIGGCPVNGPSVIARGTRVVVAWFTLADGVPRVRFAISEDAGATFGEPITRSPGSALGRVQLAWTRDGFVLAWMEETDGNARMRLTQYSPDGTRRRDRVLTRIDRGRISGFPQIAVQGDQLLVAWTAAGDADENKRTRIMTGRLRLAE